MEEAVCDEGQAELALEAVQYDVEKAIRNIGTLLRNFVVLKGKFFHQRSTIFGLFIVIVDIRTNHVVRIRTVISYNPVIFETNLALKWVTFEKQLFAHRLQDGAVRDLSQDIEQVLHNQFIQDDRGVVYEAFKNGDTDRILQLAQTRIIDYLAAHYPGTPDAGHKTVENFHLIIECEEVTQTQFRYLESMHDEDKKPPVQPKRGDGLESLLLNVTLIEDEDGICPEDLVEGAIVHSRITDERDIAQYLGKLMGGRSGSEFIPLPSSVAKVEVKDNYVEVHTDLTPDIIGIAAIPKQAKLKVLFYADENLRKKIFPW